MKLVPKLSLALFAGVVAVVAVFGTWRVRDEIEVFDQDLRKDHRVIGLTASTALSLARTREEAFAMTNRVDASRANMHIRYVSLGPDATDEERPLMSLKSKDVPASVKWLQIVKPRVAETDTSDTLVTYVSAPVAGEPDGAIELSQPLASRTEYAHVGFVRALTSISAMLVVGGVAVSLIGARVVGQPVAELIAATRRIGEGDFDVLESPSRADEFGELARAMRAMSLELAAERKRATAEAGARIRALEQLRHAERLATLGQLASVLAHEVGTPLNVIAGHGKLIATGRLLADGIRESGVAIGVQCDRITNIVRRVLDYARRAPPKRRPLQAVDVAAQTWEMLRSLALQKQVELSVVVPTKQSEQVELLADPDQIQQALTNVVMNALHASPPHSKVLLSIEPKEVETEGRVQQLVGLVVRDEGPGIAPELRDKIFEPFFTTKPLGEGTGLGLSVAKDIIEEHGGALTVDSNAFQGTTFTIYLPRNDASANPHS